MQHVKTDRPRNGEPLNQWFKDPSDDPATGPYYYGQNEADFYSNKDGYLTHFVDDPNRPVLPTDWSAELFLVGLDYDDATTYTRLVKITYGFNIVRGLVVLKPLQIKVLQ